jgi:cyclopropane fatty-acyl-phospholipid synthase-like methyltransferase
MTYSCGIFEELDGDLHSSHRTSTTCAEMAKIHPLRSGQNGEGGDELHDAQIRKYMHVIKKADVKSHHRVLEIGSGKNFS